MAAELGKADRPSLRVRVRGLHIPMSHLRPQAFRAGAIGTCLAMGREAVQGQTVQRG